MKFDVWIFIFTIINLGLLCCIPFLIHKGVEFLSRQKVMEKEIAELKEKIKDK